MCTHCAQWLKLIGRGLCHLISPSKYPFIEEISNLIKVKNLKEPQQYNVENGLKLCVDHHQTWIRQHSKITEQKSSTLLEYYLMKLLLSSMWRNILSFPFIWINSFFLPISNKPIFLNLSTNPLTPKHFFFFLFPTNLFS